MEVSPNPVLLPSIEDSLYHLDLPGTVVPSLRRNADEQRSMLEALGMLYGAGQTIEWHRLYPQGGQFVRLPAYPWQRQRYWVDPPQNAQVAPTAVSMQAMHPLLGRRLRSALKDIQFESNVSLATTPYLDDHHVCGRAVFPAAAYLEMLWQAAAAWDSSPHEVAGVVLHDLLTFENEEEHLLQTILTPTGDGEGKLQLFRWEADAEAWHLHVTGCVRAAQLDGDLTRSDLDSMQARCSRELPPAAYYERLREEGREYGPRFRGIESIWSGKGEVMGLVRLPETLAVEGSAALRARGVRVERLTVSHAFHSPLMDPMLDALERLATRVHFAEPQIELIANLTGQRLGPGSTLDGRYLRRHAREAVRFRDGMVSLNELGYSLFIELGPSPVLLGESHDTWD